MVCCVGFGAGQHPVIRAQFSTGLSFLSIGDQQLRYTLQPHNRTAYEILTRKEYRSFFALFIHPRFNLARWPTHQLGLNLSLPVTLSFFGEAQLGNVSPLVHENRNYFLTNLPFLLELAIGQKAYCRCASRSRTGGFVSLGGTFTYGSGKVGKFKSVTPYGMIGIRQGIGKWTCELSAGTSLLPDYHHPETLVGTPNYYPSILSFHTPRKLASTVNLAFYFR